MGMTDHRFCPPGTKNAVLSLDSGCSNTCQNPLSKSIVMNCDDGPMSGAASSQRLAGYMNGRVTALSFR